MLDLSNKFNKFLEKKISSRSKTIRFFFTLIERYSKDRVSEKGAQLAYYFLFSLCPLIILTTVIIEAMEFDLIDFIRYELLIPFEVAEMLEGYIRFLRGSSSPTLLWTGLILTLWFFSRATRSLQDALDTAMRTKERRSSISRVATSLFITTGLLASIPLGIVFAFTGRRVLEWVSTFFPQIVDVIEFILGIRGLVVTGYFFMLLLVIYTFGPSVKLSIKQALPGTAFTLLSWMAASTAFSYYVENMASYSVLYGSLGAMLVLLLWLYITGIVIVLGGEVNAILYDMSKIKRRSH